MPDTRGGSPAMWRIFAFVRALLAGGELPRTPLLKLSEKGFEQRSKHEFGRYTEHEIGQKEPFGSLWGYAANTSETFRTVSLGTGVKITWGRSFSWLRGGPARVMEHL